MKSDETKLREETQKNLSELIQGSNIIEISGKDYTIVESKKLTRALTNSMAFGQISALLGIRLGKYESKCPDCGFFMPCKICNAKLCEIEEEIRKGLQWSD